MAEITAKEKNATTSNTKKHKRTPSKLEKDITNVIIEQADTFNKANEELFKTDNSKEATDILQTEFVKRAEALYGEDYMLEYKKYFDKDGLTVEINNMINKQIDDIVKSRVREARQKFDDSSIGSALSTAKAYYKKIYDSEKLMADWRNQYTKTLTKGISNSIQNRFDKLDQKLGKWGRLILPASLLGKNISNFVTGTISGIIGAIINNEAIAKASKDIINTVNRIKNTIKDQVVTTFKDQIDYGKKVKKAIEEQIKKYKDLKDKYVAQAQAYVNKLQKAIMDQVLKWENAAINEISKFIKVSLGGMSL